MRIRTAILTLALLVGAAFSASAQHPHAASRADMASQDTVMQGSMTGMMQGPTTGTMQGPMMGMMQMHMQMMEQVMKDPLRRASALVRVLPTMKGPLELSDEQASRLEETARSFAQRRSALEEERAEADRRLRNLLVSDAPDPDEVSTLLHERAAHDADLTALDFEAAARMKSELTGEQRATLARMTPMKMHHHMTTHMTMMEMMQAMHGDMHAGGMMTGTMHPGNMMPGGTETKEEAGMMNR